MGAEATIEIEQGKVWPSLSDMISQSKDWPNEVGPKGWGGDKDKELLLAFLLCTVGPIPPPNNWGLYSFWLYSRDAIKRYL